MAPLPRSAMSGHTDDASRYRPKVPMRQPQFEGLVTGVFE